VPLGYGENAHGISSQLVRDKAPNPEYDDGKFSNTTNRHETSN
jgi:hypothetical protein